MQPDRVTYLEVQNPHACASNNRENHLNILELFFCFVSHKKVLSLQSVRSVQVPFLKLKIIFKNLPWMYDILKYSSFSKLQHSNIKI